VCYVSWLQQDWTGTGVCYVSWLQQDWTETGVSETHLLFNL
jgi:hypothetical protein